jgi:hypothetical protein
MDLKIICKIIKGYLKKDDFPLEQIGKIKILELDAFYEDLNLLDLKSQSEYKNFVAEHCEDPLHPDLNIIRQFRFLKLFRFLNLTR